MRLWAAAALLVGLSIGAHPLAATARAQPEITESDPREGELLSAPPEVIHVCFSEPVVITDRDAFSFRLTAPDGLGLGFRAEFLGRGECVDIHPGGAAGEVNGAWILDWQVASLATGQQSSGRLRFSVSGGGSPTPPLSSSPTAGAAPSPALTAAASPQGSGVAESGGGPDILLIALIIAGAIAGSTLLGLVAYRLRSRLRRPPTDGGGPAAGH